MPTLSHVDIHTGERTGPLDVLNGLGKEVGSKVRCNSIRGFYTVSEIRQDTGQSAQIFLELHAKMISLAEPWELVEVTAGEHAEEPEAPAEVPAEVPAVTISAPVFAAAAKSKTKRKATGKQRKQQQKEATNN